MENDKLMKELEEEFRSIKKELGFKSGLEEIDKIFFIRDLVLEKGFVSKDFSNQMRMRIFDVFVFWDNYLHNLIMPNPQNLFNMHEAKVFDESGKKDIIKMMSRVAHLVARNTFLRLSRNNKEESRLIDDSVRFWKQTYLPFYIKIVKKIEGHWKEEKPS